MDLLQNNKHRKKIQVGLTTDYWSIKFLLLYILTMPFVSAFAFTGTISLPVIFSVFLFMIMIVQIFNSVDLPKEFLGIDIILVVLFLSIALLSFVVNGLGNSKSLNHTVAYLSTFLLFYVSIKFILFKIKDKNYVFKKVLLFITYTTIISAVFANVEFILSNVFGININDYIPRPSAAEEYYDATVLALFYRARGFAPESGHFAFMMELFSPLAVYYMYFSGLCKWSKFLKLLAIIFIISSFIFAVSSASFVIIPISVFFASFIYIRKIFLYVVKKSGRLLIITSIIAAIVLMLNYFFSFYTLLFLSVTDKLNSGSYEDRQDRINFFYDKFYKLSFIKKIIGTGPAGFDILGFDSSKSILSLYYSIPFELGFFGLLLVLLFFIYTIIQCFTIKSKIGFFLLVSIIAGVLHFYFIANFWYPWFWFIAAFTIFCSKNFQLKVYGKSST